MPKLDTPGVASLQYAAVLLLVLGRDQGASGSTPAAMSTLVAASWAVSANTDTQSSDQQAGKTPCVLNSPLVGLCPIRLLKEAGTRPEPAVSVPKANDTWPSAVAMADPELLPPLM